MDLVIKDEDSRSWLPPDLLRQLFVYCTYLCNFQFEGKNYDQDGLAMGNPLAHPLAHLFMIKIQEIALSTTVKTARTFRFKSLTWIRYVDDIYVRLRRSDRNRIPQILDYLNSIHPNIKFTVEIEENGAQPFLEVLCRSTARKNGRYETSVFRKKTHTNLYVRWDSAHPSSQKIGIVRTLLHRVQSVCNTPSGEKAEIDHLKRTFLELGYPENQLNSCIQSFKNKSRASLPEKKTLSA